MNDDIEEKKTGEWMTPRPEEFPKWREAMITKILMIQPKLPARAIRVATALIDIFANSGRGGLAWPGKLRLGFCSGMDERAVRRAFRDLEKAGVVKISPRWDPEKSEKANWSNECRFLITRTEMKAILSVKKMKAKQIKKMVDGGVPPLEALACAARVREGNPGQKGGQSDPPILRRDTPTKILRNLTSKAACAAPPEDSDSKKSAIKIESTGIIKLKGVPLKQQCFAAAREKFGADGATWVGKYIKGADDQQMQKILALVEEAKDTEAVRGIDWLAGSLFTEFYDPFAKERNRK